MSKLANWLRSKQEVHVGSAMPHDLDGSYTLGSTSVRSERVDAQWYVAARLVLSLVLLGAGLYVLQNYLRALVWALVLAIALWPLFERTAARVPAKRRKEALPALFVLLVLFVFLIPLVTAGIEAVVEAHSVLDYAKQAEQNGIPARDRFNVQAIFLI